MAKENVNHPSHYCQHPAGIECIDIIRHYTCDIANAIKYLWRAGLKAELGKDDADKEIEDLNKALWYINDYRKHINKRSTYTLVIPAKGAKKMERVVCEAQVGMKTGYELEKIVSGYNQYVSDAMRQLLQIGIINDEGIVYVPRTWRSMLNVAIKHIKQRIIAIEKQLLETDIDDIRKMMCGELVEGLDTVKPACKREDEPADYDPMNLIIIQGTAYGLSAEVHKKDNGALYIPCDLCHFSDVCVSKDGDEPVKMLCLNLHNAYDHEYYREVGDARYAPSFGTITIVDPKKELEKQMREMEEEEEE